MEIVNFEENCLPSTGTVENIDDAHHRDGGGSRAGGPAEEPDVEVQEHIADGSANNNSHITESRVGSRGPTLSKINTP